MSAEPQVATTNDEPGESVEMPRPTVAPMVLSLGLALMGAGVIFGLAFLLVGAVVLITGLGMWISSLLPGQGHMHEALAALDERCSPSSARPDWSNNCSPDGRAIASRCLRWCIPRRPAFAAGSWADW